MWWSYAPTGTTRLYDDDDDDSGLFCNLGLYIFVRGFRRAYNREGEFISEGAKKRFETSYSGAGQKKFCIYWFLIKFQNGGKQVNGVVLAKNLLHKGA